MATAIGVDVFHEASSVRHRKRGRVCPRCQGDVSRVALVDVVYTFEECTCGVPEYGHLIEQLYHRECFRQVTA